MLRPDCLTSPLINIDLGGGQGGLSPSSYPCPCLRGPSHRLPLPYPSSLSSMPPLPPPPPPPPPPRLPLPPRAFASALSAPGPDDFPPLPDRCAHTSRGGRASMVRSACSRTPERRTGETRGSASRRGGCRERKRPRRTWTQAIQGLTCPNWMTWALGQPGPLSLRLAGRRRVLLHRMNPPRRIRGWGGSGGCRGHQAWRRPPP